MRSSWQQTTVGEIADVFDGPHATPKKTATGPYFLSISSLSQGLLDLSKSAHLSETDFSKWTRRVTPLAGDVLFSYETRLGEAALMPEGVRGCLGRRMGLLRPRRDLVDPRYLLLAYLGPQFQQEIRARTISGATVERIALKELPSFPIVIPPLPEQRRIAAVLGALDDKIELNRKMNQTLEAIAQALFKSWFVDFDGVPTSELVESDLGWIPNGWTSEPIGSLVKVVGGSTPRTKNPEYWKGGTHQWTTPKDLSSCEGPILLSTARRITDSGLSNISSGLLPQGTFLLSSRAPVGYTALTGAPMAVNQGYIAIPPGDALTPLFLYCWANLSIDLIKSRAGGTTFQEISKRNFRPIQVVVPPETLRMRFQTTAQALFEKIEANQRECATLSELRDTLLPKLISGELRVPEIEGLLSEAS